MKIDRHNFLKTGIFAKGYVAAVKKIVCTSIFFTVFAVKAQEMKIYSGCNLVANGNVFIVVNNTAFKNNGTFTAGSGTVSFTGNGDTTASYISGTSTTNFNNLTVDKSAYGTAMKSAVGVKSVLTVSAGNLYADGNLTLLSTASNTARLAAVPSGANVFGKATVERYIPSRRAWRLMTAPVTDAFSIYNSWQNGGVYTVARGLLVSGPGAANGLDNGNASSLKSWDVASQSLLPVLNTYTSISPTNTGSADNAGYFVFVRGDRALSNFQITNSNITTLSSIGNLQTGNQVFTASATAGKYTLIGNPYASPINFNSVTRNNLVKRFYVWDPTLNTLGGYVVLDDLDNDGVFSKSVAGSSQTKEIQSSQAFFVETNSNGAASLTVTESAKSTTNNSPVFRPSSFTSSIRADLFLLGGDSSVVLADGVLAEFNSIYNDAVTNEDALKFGNVNENLGLLRRSTFLGIERRPLITGNDTLFLKLSKTTQRKYQLHLSPENMDQPGMIAFLEDSYLATSTPLNLSGVIKINFAINSDAASASGTRFRIVFMQASVLPVTFTSIKASLVNGKVEVNWKVEEEINVSEYQLEKSADGVNFQLVSAIPANGSGNYFSTDENAFAGKNFYRIKSIDKDGSIKYSPVVNVMIEKMTGRFTIQPNPVKGNSIQLHFANQPAGTYGFNLTNGAGQLVYTGKQKIGNAATIQVLNITAALPAGVYQLQISGPAGSVETQKVIIEQ
jgi:hypothetical protein